MHAALGNFAVAEDAPQEAIVGALPLPVEPDAELRVDPGVGGPAGGERTTTAKGRKQEFFIGRLTRLVAR